MLTNGGFPVVDGIVTSFDSIDKVTPAALHESLARLHAISPCNLVSHLLSRFTPLPSFTQVTLAKYGLASLLNACKATGTCESFREMFLSTDDRRYIA